MEARVSHRYSVSQVICSAAGKPPCRVSLNLRRTPLGYSIPAGAFPAGLVGAYSFHSEHNLLKQNHENKALFVIPINLRSSDAPGDERGHADAFGLARHLRALGPKRAGFPGQLVGRGAFRCGTVQLLLQVSPGRVGAVGCDH